MKDTLPDRIQSVAELDERLSRPSDALVSFMAGLDGDLMIVGAGGKVGPTLARMARRAVAAAGTATTVHAVDVLELPDLAAEGIQTHRCDLLDLEAVERLPAAENIVFMAGRKFGSTGSEDLTWAINVIVPYHVARTFPAARIAVFSTGCVYPVSHVFSGGATEETPPEPVGEYAMSCLGRERMFDYQARARGTRVVHIRLNYAVELRYGVLADIAARIWTGQPVDLTTGFANVIWQGDACRQVLQALELAAHPPSVLNITGPETFSVRQVARVLGRLLDKPVAFTGTENGRGYLNNAMRANQRFGNPEVPLGTILQWLAHWVRHNGECLGKETHFETQDGKY